MGAITLEKFLVDQGAVDARAVARARRSGAETGQPLSSALVNLGLISSVELAEMLSALTGFAVVTAADFPEAAIEAPDLSRAFLRKRKLLPLGIDDKSVRLAMADPTDEFARQAIAFAMKTEVLPLVAPLADLDEAIERLYFREEKDDEDASGEGELWADGEADDAERLRELASDAPVIKYVNRLIHRAVEAGASDIHFEPMEARYGVRFRIDGMLVDADSPGKGMQAAVTSRIKIMANLNIAERRLPQDGRFKVALEGREIDFRVSTSPTSFGESVVLRLLERDRLPGNFAALGFAEDAVAPLMAALSRPEGIVLVTGPTGSGKTTTLYSALQLLNSTERKILTVEDPIEYVLDGINQVQIDPRIGRTFASTLRSFLRQDPDVMMVGEIRDRETAEIAIQAALTGHLVLSTLHTNSAAGALTRLLDMGVDDYLIASTVTVIVAQRLVRRLCAVCREPYAPDAKLRERLGIAGGETIYRPGTDASCKTCGGAGYSGRTGLIEILEVDADIRRLVQQRADTSTIEKVAREAGMVTISEYGAARVRDGLTSFEEILRVTREA